MHPRWNTTSPYFYWNRNNFSNTAFLNFTRTFFLFTFLIHENRYFIPEPGFVFYQTA